MTETAAAVTAIVVGLVLAAVGWFFIRDAGGLAIQGAGNGDEFRDGAADLEGVRRASTVDIMILVPGYMMWTLGIFALFWTSAGMAHSAKVASVVGSFIILAAVVADQIENLIVRLGIGNVDDAAKISVSDTLLTTLRVSYYVKYGLLAAAFGALVVTVVLWRANP